MPHTTLLARIRGEYLEMPGLRLTFEQAQRLFGVDRMLCRMMLDALVEARFLCVRPDGAYARLVEGGDVLRPRPPKADRATPTRVELAS